MAKSFSLEVQFGGYEELHQFFAQFITGEGDLTLKGTAKAIRQYSHHSYTLDLEGPDVDTTTQLPTVAISPIEVIIGRISTDKPFSCDISGAYHYKADKPPSYKQVDLSIGELTYSLDGNIQPIEGGNKLQVSPDAFITSGETGVNFVSTSGYIQGVMHLPVID